MSIEIRNILLEAFSRLRIEGSDYSFGRIQEILQSMKTKNMSFPIKNRGPGKMTGGYMSSFLSEHDEKTDPTDLY